MKQHTELLERDILLYRCVPQPDTESHLKADGELMSNAGATGLPVWVMNGTPPKDVHSMPGLAVKKIEYNGGFGIAIWLDESIKWGNPVLKNPDQP